MHLLEGSMVSNEVILQNGLGRIWGGICRGLFQVTNSAFAGSAQGKKRRPHSGYLEEHLRFEEDT
jgi:hypothetical protein